MKGNACCYSLKGKGHELNGVVNQDAVGYYLNNYGHVLVVSDGLGSKSESDIGSKVLVETVNKVVALTDDKTDMPSFIKLLSILWKINIKDDPSEYACTAVVVIVYSSGQVRCLQLGDGIAVIKDGEDYYELSASKDVFSNMTIGMNKSKLSDWQSLQFERKSKLQLMLATDGISDDIEDGQHLQFMQSVIGNFTRKNGRYKPVKYWNKVVKFIVDNWTCPNSIDDKTMLIYIEK